ncbi:envoplakin a [Pholidichthys leucotaenia]
MFKKKTQKDGTLKSSGKTSKTQANDLALLVAQMQSDADLVEKDILRSEELLAVDAENEKKELPFQHQDEISKKLGEAEGLLEKLFLDVGRAKKSNHPQCREIEGDIINLHQRWLKDCSFYRDIYEQIDDVSRMPLIDWGPVFADKQKTVNAEKFGPTMTDLEKQIGEHNLAQKELEGYNQQLCLASAGSKEKYTALKKQYNSLLDNSKWRSHYLKSLHAYMQDCNKEMTFLGEEQEKIKKQDWSDRIVDPSDVRRRYESFKNNNLLSHESEVNKVQDEGDRLIEAKHPAASTIQTQKDAVRNEWQKFLNLCICQETHLDNVEENKKFQYDVEKLSETLAKLNNTMDPKTVSKKSTAETLLHLEGEEKTVQDAEQLLANLRRRSTTVPPLKLRRNPPGKSLTVESLCDWETNQGSLERGEKFTLKSNSDIENWSVFSSDGTIKTFPGVCFQIPPPDTEATDKVNLLGSELAEIKKKRAALTSSLKNKKSDVTKSQRSVPVSSTPVDPKITSLAQELDQMDKDLASAEQSMLNSLRAPLNQSDPASDLAQRLMEQEKAAKALKALQDKQQATQADLQPLLSKDPNSTSYLPLQLNDSNNKYDRLAELADLYSKKTKASLTLENQIKKVDGLVSGFEKKLSEDSPIPDTQNAIQYRAEDIKNQKNSVAAAQGDMRKLSTDLDTTEQLCSSLQHGYQEYCPSIPHQRNKVKQLQNRYNTVANQLKERENILQEAATKNQEYQSASQSLNTFLNNMPDNQINASDNLSQIASKQNSQERLMDDLRRKQSDIDRVGILSQDLQNLLSDYETNVDKYNSVLEESGATVAKKPRMDTLSDAIEKQEKDLLSRYAETIAENTQRQKQMSVAKSLVSQNEEKVQLVAQQQVQLQNQQKNAFELDSLYKDLEEEKDRVHRNETDLKTFRDRLISLQSRKGVERIEEREVVHYYRDPKLESDLVEFQKTLQEEFLKRSTTQTEVEVFNKKIIVLEDKFNNAPPKLITREVTEFEKDPQLDVEAAKLRDDIARMEDEIRLRDGEQIQMKTEVTILQSKAPLIREKVVKKELIKMEKDPEMLRAVQTFETEISEENNRIKQLNDLIFGRRAEINVLEREIPNIQPNVIVKEIKKIEQDPELVAESKKIRENLVEERNENDSLRTEVMTLQSRYREVQNLKPKVEMKEIVNEIYRIDPNTETEIIRLRRNIQDTSRQRSDLDREITQVTTDLNFLRSQKPIVETKEVLQEVIKEERSPENEREIRRLNEQLYSLTSTHKSLQENVLKLTNDRDEWKAEKSKIETKIVQREVIRYEADPLQEKEADRLRKNLREEAQLRRNIEDMLYDLKNKYIVLERQKPEEKVVVQEVIRVQKDPRQVVEHEKLGRNLDEEVMSRRKIELELQQLRSSVHDKERILRESDERQRRIQAETELQEIRLRITQLENAPPPVEESIVVEEVLKVERDPKLERLTNGLRTDMDKETSDILRLQREIRNITIKIEVLQKEKSGERTIYKEIVRVEKDQAVESERDRLREQVSQTKFDRQNLEDTLRRINDKIHVLRTNQSSTSRDETTLTMNRDALLREKDNLTRELRTLETTRHDISQSFHHQSRLMSERTQMSRQMSLRLESEIMRLEREILDEKDRIHQRDSIIRDLRMKLQNEEQVETRTKETNVSTKITILDPVTGQDMSPYDAYLQGVIDRAQYLQLQKMECDWEEITSMGPDGEISLLQDRKSGKQYSIKKAINDKRVSEYDLQQYKQGKMPISEFALLVAGDKINQPQTNSGTNYSSRTIKSSPLDSSSTSENFPVAGIMDTNTDTCYTIRGAALRRLIDLTSAQRLLEAQAATGGIIDITTKERFPVQRALHRGLIDDSQQQRLLNAQKAFTGVEDPKTRECLSVGEAVQKGWMPKETASRYLEAQHLTGGLVDPNTGRRVSIMDAIGSKMIDSTMLRELQSETTYIKDIIDPLTKEKINYKQALDRCKKDPVSGLLMLPASSKVSNTAYNNYARF